MNTFKKNFPVENVCPLKEKDLPINIKTPKDECIKYKNIYFLYYIKHKWKKEEKGCKKYILTNYHYLSNVNKYKN